MDCRASLTEWKEIHKMAKFKLRTDKQWFQTHREFRGILLSQMKHTWITADGQTILIEKMHDEHLLNVHRFLRKKEIEIQEFNKFYFSPLAPKKGADGFEETEEKYESFQIEVAPRLAKQVKIFMEEIVKRGLTPKEII